MRHEPSSRENRLFVERAGATLGVPFWSAEDAAGKDEGLFCGGTCSCVAYHSPRLAKWKTAIWLWPYLMSSRRPGKVADGDDADPGARFVACFSRLDATGGLRSTWRHSTPLCATGLSSAVPRGLFRHRLAWRWPRSWSNSMTDSVSAVFMNCRNQRRRPGSLTTYLRPFALVSFRTTNCNLPLELAGDAELSWTTTSLR